MQTKFFFKTAKCFFYVGSFLILIIFSNYFTGCSGSDEVEVTQRDKDSIEIYTNLQKSFALYKKALIYNESSDIKNAADDFELSLNNLNKINYEIIVKPENYFWKKDYDELAKSIVEDYLITQNEISQSSLVFDFAKRVSVNYERIEEVSGDREPLPDGNDVPLIKNSAVEQYIEFFSNTERGRSFVDKCLYRSGKFFPIMRKILRFNNAPEELIYLSVQESGLSPTIVSRAGAVGLWQFMPATGTAYGLYQDGYTDDRRDFEKSSDAAARLLKDLYRTFDDWYLAFSAYNAGPGRVKKAISKSGSKDFWTLRNYLPGETKNYVPSIIALSFVLRNPGEYGFNDVEYGSPLSYDRVNIKSELSLQKVAELCDSDIESIRELNSELTNDVVPVYDEPYQLRIPHKSFEKFAANYEKATDIDKSSNYSPQFAGNETAGFVGNITLAQYKVENYQPEDIRNIGSTNGRKKVSHEYKKKELLEVIAVKYSVRPIDIRLWNNLAYGTKLKSKQNLDIYLTEERYKLLFGIKDGEDTGKESVVENSINNSYLSEIDNNSEVQDEVEIVKPLSENNSGTTVTEDNSSDDNSTEINSSETNTEENVNTKNNSNESETELTASTQDNSSDNNTESEYDEEEVVQQTETTKPEVKTVSVNRNKNTSLATYTVTEGDNLSAIAKEFGVSVSELMEWNNLETDKIMSGQKLKVKENKNSKTSNTKTSGVKKTYKVKKGETLASIANVNDISIQDLIKWNNLKNDKIIVGQVLKLYDDGAKTKLRKKKN